MTKTQRNFDFSHARAIATLSVVAFLLLALTSSAFASGAVEHVIYNFNGFPAYPGSEAGLVADRTGNLYGTTPASHVGGDCVCGSVFELSPPAAGSSAWTMSLVYAFHRGDTDGQTPYGTLIFDKQGNLYGTTSLSRSSGPGSNTNGAGAVFELSPPATAGGAWTETILYFFPLDGTHGAQPLGKLATNGEGNLYGTTSAGGTYNAGTVFKLKAPSVPGGRWTESVVHNFGAPGDGSTPNKNLIFSGGALYGTTAGGAEIGSGNGVVFQLVRSGATWKENILYYFSGSFDGFYPEAGLIADTAGNLYSTILTNSNTSGAYGYGRVYRLSPPAVAGRAWTESTLYSFTGDRDGAYPHGSLHFDKEGNLYGTTSGTTNEGGGYNNDGTVFKLSPPTVTGGAWTETVLHRFEGEAYNDGAEPMGELIRSNGRLYGTTAMGGSANSGTVFTAGDTP